MIRFTTDEYVWSHGRAPRGYGLWVFRFSHNGQSGRESLDYLWTHGSYADAKVKARRAARACGAARVHVMP